MTEITNTEGKDDKDVSTYFDQIKTENKDAIDLAIIPEDNIKEKLEKGQIDLEVENQFHNIVKKRKRKDKINQKQQRKKSIKKNLSFLNHQYQIKGKPNPQISQSTGITVLTRKEHRQFMKKISKNQSSLGQLRQKRQQLRKSRIDQQKEKYLKEQEIQNEKSLEKIKQREKKLEENKERQKERIQREKQTNKKILQIKQKKCLHDKLQENYENGILMPILEEKKKKLKEIREFKKCIDFQELKNHEEEYLKNKEKHLENSQARIQKQFEGDYKKPQKSQKLIQLLEEENLKIKLDKEEKRRQLQERQRKKKEYIQELKERTPPKISEKKKEQILKRLKRQEREERDSRMIGLNYLHKVGKKKRSGNSVIEIRRMDETEISKPYTNYLERHQNLQFYEEERKRRIQKILKSDNYDSQKKIEILKMEAERIEAERERKQELMKVKVGQRQNEAGILVDSLRSKLHLLNLINPQ